MGTRVEKSRDGSRLAREIRPRAEALRQRAWQQSAFGESPKTMGKASELVYADPEPMADTSIVYVAVGYGYSIEGDGTYEGYSLDIGKQQAPDQPVTFYSLSFIPQKTGKLKLTSIQNAQPSSSEKIDQGKAIELSLEKLVEDPNERSALLLQATHSLKTSSPRRSLEEFFGGILPDWLTLNAALEAKHARGLNFSEQTEAISKTLLPLAKAVRPEGVQLYSDGENPLPGTRITGVTFTPDADVSSRFYFVLDYAPVTPESNRIVFDLFGKNLNYVRVESLHQRLELWHPVLKRGGRAKIIAEVASGLPFLKPKIRRAVKSRVRTYYA